MKNKITQATPLLLAAVAAGVGKVSGETAVYFFALYILPITIVLLFVRSSTFSSWLRFALVALPLALLFVVLTPVSSLSYMDLFPFYRDDAARVAGEAFTALSLILVVWRTATSRRLGA